VPNDPLCRNFDALSGFEIRHPAMFSEMYKFWCRKLGDINSIANSGGPPSKPTSIVQP
jgi:hypothetical protein